jgi:hypothetical protein
MARVLATTLALTLLVAGAASAEPMGRHHDHHGWRHHHAHGWRHHRR